MINTILHVFDLHLSSMIEIHNTKAQTRRLKRNLKRCRVKNRVLNDIALGIKREDLEILYKHACYVKTLINKYTAQRDIFV